MKYVYGPIESRRLGLSLGISLTPYKVCTFDCIYCQLGRTEAVVRERKEYVSIEDILGELKLWLGENSSCAAELNYITLSGAGEPLLNTKIGELIQQIKRVTTIPVAVITNSSFLSDKNVRQALKQADLLVPTLNTTDKAVFQRISRPAVITDIDSIVQGLIDLRKEFRGKIWLEIMLIRTVNDSLKQIRALKDAVVKINPDKVQLNSPVRVTAEAGIMPVESKNLEKIKEIFGDRCEII